jgi:integrase
MTRPHTTRLQLAAWPAGDQLAWTEILGSGGRFDKRGPGARWSAETRTAYREAYRCWLGFLATTARLAPASPPAARVTPEMVAAYLTSLEGLADYTVLTLVEGLLAVSLAMAPERDWSWLRATIAQRRRQGSQGRQDKQPRLKDSAVLFAAGLALIDEADEAGTPLLQALGHRDGLMLATLAARPLRRSNFALIELERHLVRDGPGWRLVFAAQEMKARKPLALPWPERLIAPLERYLAQHRPVLLRGQASSRLWISRWRRPMTSHAVYLQIAAITKERFGQPMNPHVFRDCLATSVAVRDPDQVRIATALLGHTSPRTTEDHYIQAPALEAGRLYQQGLLALRRELASPSPRKVRTR